MADYPLIETALCKVLHAGGLVAFRDYLSYLGQQRPTFKATWRRMPLSLGRQCAMAMIPGRGRSVVRERPRPHLGYVVDAMALEQVGLLDSSTEYGYDDLGDMIEKTLEHWVDCVRHRTTKEEELLGAYQEAMYCQGPVFLYAESGEDAQRIKGYVRPLFKYGENNRRLRDGD